MHNTFEMMIMMVCIEHCIRRFLETKNEAERLKWKEINADYMQKNLKNI